VPSLPVLTLDLLALSTPCRCRTAGNVDAVQIASKALHAFSIGGIFSLLHQQLYDEKTRQKVGTGFLNSLIIPDTIVFRVGHVGHPMWYFSSASEPGMIKRKNSTNVTPQTILEVFTRRKTKRSVHHASNSGIIAVLISDAHPSADITEEDRIGSATVEYLDEVLLRDFLERRAVTFSGLLQKWVDPKGHSNSMIHATWTPKLCSVACLTNVKSMSDRRSTMYERAVTFDGADSFTRRDPVSSTIQNHITYLCSSIAKHVSAITEAACEIQRSTSYFKVRSDGKVVYMWSSSMRVRKEDQHASNIPLATRESSPVMSAPHSMDVKYDAQRERNYVCPVSNKVCPWNEAKTFITYKMIIQEWNAHYPADTEGQEAYRPSSARFRPSSAGTPRQPPHEPATRERTSSARYSQLATCTQGENGEEEERTSLDQPGGKQAHASNNRVVYSGALSKGSAKPALTVQNCIPELIRKLEHMNDVELYRRLLQDPTFLYKQVRVCSEVAVAYTRIATAHQDPSAKTGQGLGHFLDGIPFNVENARPFLSQATQQNQEKGQKKQALPARQPLLPKLDLRGKLTGKPDNRSETGDAIQPEREESSGRKVEDMEQHKKRLEAARERAHTLSLHRFDQVPAREKAKAKRQPNAIGLNVFTDWKKQCKNDDQILESLKQRVGRAGAGAVTERTRPTPFVHTSVPTQPLSARPHESVRSSTSGRPIRQFSMAAAAIDPALASELAYHTEQAAMQKRFLDQMILDTKLRLNLGSAGANRAPDAADAITEGAYQPRQPGHQQSSAMFPEAMIQQSDPSIVPLYCGEDAKAQARAIQEKHGEEASSGEEQSSEDEGASDEGYSDMCEDESAGEQENMDSHVQQTFSWPSEAPHSSICRLQDVGNARFPEHGSSASGVVQSEISSPRVDEMANEMLLAALHMATRHAPEKHRCALQEILPELESDEQSYFLNVITDLKGYSEDALQTL
jgi:hypothetical protein